MFKYIPWLKGQIRFDKLSQQIISLLRNQKKDTKACNDLFEILAPRKQQIIVTVFMEEEDNESM